MVVSISDRRDARKDITRPEIHAEFRSRVDRLAQRIRESQSVDPRATATRQPS